MSCIMYRQAEIRYRVTKGSFCLPYFFFFFFFSPRSKELQFGFRKLIFTEYNALKDLETMPEIEKPISAQQPQPEMLML